MILDEVLDKVLCHMQINREDTVNSAEPIEDPYANDVLDLQMDDGLTRQANLRLPILQARSSTEGDMSAVQANHTGKSEVQVGVAQLRLYYRRRLTSSIRLLHSPQLERRYW